MVSIETIQKFIKQKIEANEELESPYSLDRKFERGIRIGLSMVGRFIEILEEEIR